MKLFKSFLFSLFLILSSISYGQSIEIDKELTSTGVFIRTVMFDDTFGREVVLFCDLDAVDFLITKKKIIIHSSQFTLDIDIKKRKVGQYNSWVGLDRISGKFFFITSFRVNTGGYGMFIQPIHEDLTADFTTPQITIANFNLCPTEER